jgi:hypothetical protein
MNWISVKDRLPEHGRKVLASFPNKLGKRRLIVAYHTERWKEEIHPWQDDEYETSEYCEAKDEYYLLEGWYECIENWPEYTSVVVCEGEITHWMPLPDPPEEP